MWLIDKDIFQHPFTCILSGPTMCGKTHLLKEILKNKHVLISPTPQRIIICYKAWQNFYDEFKRLVPNSFEDATKKPHGYLFLDLKQTTEFRNRIQSGILPNQLRVIYTQKYIILFFLILLSFFF